MIDTAVEFSGVTKRYKYFTLDQIDLKLPTGYNMGFVGANGAGKSTTLRILMGLVHQDAGGVKVLGHAMPGDQTTAKREIGFACSCAASSLFVIALVARFARPWRWADSLSANAYGIYLVHYAFVIWIQYVALRWTVPALVKGIAVSLATVGISWITVALLRQSKLIARVV